MQRDGFEEDLCDSCWEDEHNQKFSLTLNVVTCGKCGDAFAHKLDIEGLTCPYCGFKDDVSSFPDMWYEDGKDSIIVAR